MLDDFLILAIGVVIEACAVFHAKAAFIDALLQQTERLFGIAQVGPGVFGDIVVDIQTAQIAGLKGAEAGIAEAQRVLHHIVDSLGRGDALADDMEALAQNRLLQAIKHKAGGILDDHRLLLQLQRDLTHLLRRLICRLFAADDLDEGDDVGRIHPVHTGKALGIGHGFGDLGDAQTGGITAQNGVICHDFAQFPIEIVLDLQLFEDRLHQKIGVCQILQLVGEADALLQRGGLLRRQLAGLYLGALVDGDQLLRLLQRSGKQVVQLYGITKLGKGLRQRITHGAGTGNGNIADLFHR